ncbi:MAG: hypothetical protein HYZ72_01075, partial [Deltaproteobacteria bacterium]|nr:hypothetical protein [Deltaproteobacteria bacterium]
MKKAIKEEEERQAREVESGKPACWNESPEEIWEQQYQQQWGWLDEYLDD